MLAIWLSRYTWKLGRVMVQEPYNRKYFFRDHLRTRKKYRILAKKYKNPYFRHNRYLKELRDKYVKSKQDEVRVENLVNRPLTREDILRAYFLRVYGNKNRFYTIFWIGTKPANRHIGLMRFPLIDPYARKDVYFLRFMWVIHFYLKSKKELTWFNLDCEEENPVLDEAIWDINKRIMRQLAELRAEAAALAKEAAIKASLTIEKQVRLAILDALPKGEDRITARMMDTKLDPFPLSHKFNVFTGTSNIFFWHRYDTRWYETINVYKRLNIERKILRKMAFSATYDGIREPLEEWSARFKFGALSQYRGIWGSNDLVLIRQPNWKNFRKPVFDRYLQNFTTIYNWYYQPKLAENYKKIVYGLVGPTMKPHRSLLFTITKTRKNYYFTVSDMVGKVFLTLSAGSLNLHYRKRGSPQALEPIFKKVIACFKKLKVKNVIIIMRNRLYYLYKNMARFFKRNRIRVRAFIDRFKVAHNGIKPRKKKRL